MNVVKGENCLRTSDGEVVEKVDITMDIKMKGKESLKSLENSSVSTLVDVDCIETAARDESKSPFRTMTSVAHVTTRVKHLKGPKI